METPVKLTWIAQDNLWTGRSGDSAPYYFTLSGGLYRVSLGGGSRIGDAATIDAAKQIAEDDYARRQPPAAVDVNDLITAMRAAIDTAWSNLKDPAAIAVTVAIEAVAESVGIDPTRLRWAPRS